MDKLAVYCRVSEENQRDNYSIKAQQLDGRAFAEEHGFEPIVYVDEVVSGQKDSRTGFDQVIAGLKTHSVIGVWIGDNDRFARDSELGMRLVKTIKQTKTRYFIKKEELDLVGNAGHRLLTRMEFVVGEYELEQILERTTRGRTLAYDMGHRRPWNLYGYDEHYDPGTGKRLLTINVKEAAIVREIFEMAHGGMTQSGIARELNTRGVPTKLTGRILQNRQTKVKEVAHPKWSNSTIEHILRRPEYTGRVWNNDHTKLVDAAFVPAIITDLKSWEGITTFKHKRPLRRERGGRRATNHLLSGVVKCGICGAEYYYLMRAGKRWDIYYAHRRDVHRGCTNLPKYVRASLLDLIGTLSYQLFVRNKTEIQEFLAEQEQERTQKTRTFDQGIASRTDEANKLDENLKRLARKYAEADSDIVQRELRSLMEEDDRRKQVLLREIEGLKKERQMALSGSILGDSVDDKFKKLAAQFESVWAFDDASVTQKRKLLLTVLESATITDNQILFTFKNGKETWVDLNKRSSNNQKVEAEWLNVSYRGKHQDRVSLIDDLC